MATTVVMPKMGSAMEEAKVIRWLKNEGDEVKKGEGIAEIETEKVNIEVEAFASGVLRKILAHEGDVVPVGEPIAIVGAPAEPIPEAAEAAPPPAPAAVERRPEPQPAAPAPPGEERIRVSPVARKLAEEQGIELSKVQGTGPGGRISLEDVERASAGEVPVKPTLAVLPEQREERELSRMRKAIARSMVESKRNIPHFYITMDVDMDEALRMRESLNSLDGQKAKISINDLVLAAVARALRRYPRMNVTYSDDKMLVGKEVNLGIATALEEGLIVPVLREADRKSLWEIAEESKELAEGARAGRLSADAYSGASLTITNLGMFGVDNFIAIINPGESAIVAIGSVESVPVVKDDHIVPAKRMKVTISADHRVLDGVVAAQFLGEVREILEQPVTLLVAQEAG